MNVATPQCQQQFLPLAPTQHQVWLDQQSYPGSAHLNIGGTSTVHGSLNIQRMEQALAIIVESSTAMRLLPTEDGRQQLVDKWPGKLIDYEDLSNLEDIESTVKRKTAQQMASPFLFDGKTRPWRIYIWQHNDACYTLWIRFHHQVMDGFGTSLFFSQWSAVYNALSNNTELPLLGGISYQQFITESNDYLNSDSYRKDADYWHRLLPSLPPQILQKRSKKTDEGKLVAGIHHYAHIPQSFYKTLQDFAKTHKVTVYHIFIAVLSIYLCRCAGKKALVLGVPNLNRKGKRFKATLGMFSAVLPLRVNLEEHQSLSSLLKSIALQMRGMFRHGQYPLFHMVRDLNLLDSGRDSLFDVLLSFEPHSYNVYFEQAQLCSPRQLFAANARYPLLVNVCEFHEEQPVELVLEASSDYFTARETELLSGRLLHLLQAMVAENDADIARLPLVTDEERYNLIVGRHADIPSHDRPKPFITTFEHQAALNPGATALLWPAEQLTNHQMSYAELNKQANRLAHHLIKIGCKPGAIVPVLTLPRPQTIISFLAIAKTGGAYLPVDPLSGIQRIEKLLSYGTAGVVLCDESSLPLLENLPFKGLSINGENNPITDTTLIDTNPDVAFAIDALAVVLFTSGSTGEPKGVMMSHAGLAKRIAWFARTLNFAPQDVSLLSIQLTFDPSLNEILLPLTHGATLAFGPPQKLSPADVASYCERYGVTYISSVPTILRYISQAAKQHPNIKLKAVGCGGERLSRAVALEFVNATGANVYNVWGPTETTIFSSAYLFDPDTTQDPIPIGDPIDDTTIYILDDNLEVLPTGTTGQIYVGGTGLGLGYLNAPQLTAQKYIDNPFEPGNKMFVTGDLGYWDESGQLQFVSRIDNMIKLRGQRIEPSEVEMALAGLPFVQAAAVKLHDGELHGWIEPVDLFPDELLLTLENSLKEGLAQILPSYMIPSAFTQIAIMPRQSGGKLNYSALVADPIGPKYAVLQTHADHQPESELERVLLRLWQKNLNDDTLHVQSDFFKAGGNSLDALNLLSEVRRQLGHQLPLAALMKKATVKALSKEISERHQPLFVELSHRAAPNVLYLAASGHGDALRLKPLAEALEGKFQVRMLQPPMPDDYSNYGSIGELAEHYAGLIEQLPHERPPRLAGFSVGGISALETARKLISRNIAIDGLILIDSSYPSWLLRRTPAWQLLGWMVKRLGLQELSLNNRTLGSLFTDPGLNGQIKALSDYQPQPLAYPVCLVISSGLKRWYGRFVRPWRKLFGEYLTERHLPGFHGTLFNIENVDKLAAVMIKPNNTEDG